MQIVDHLMLVVGICLPSGENWKFQQERCLLLWSSSYPFLLDVNPTFLMCARVGLPIFLLEIKTLIRVMQNKQSDRWQMEKFPFCSHGEGSAAVIPPTKCKSTVNHTAHMKNEYLVRIVHLFYYKSFSSNQYYRQILSFFKQIFSYRWAHWRQICREALRKNLSKPLPAGRCKDVFAL